MSSPVEDKTKLSVIVFGRQAELSLAVFKGVAQHHRIVGVVESQLRGYVPPTAWQRWLYGPSAKMDIEGFARKHRIPFFVMRPGELDALAAFIRKADPQVGVIARMVQLLPMDIVSLFPFGILNVHPSLLPLYRGPIPVFWAIFNHEKVSGVTVHLIDKGEDTGDIIKQKELALSPGESAEEFADRYIREAPGMVLEALDELAAGSARPVVQRTLPCPFRARFLKPGEDPINWAEWPVERIYQVLRGADTNVDILPKREFPLNLCKWRVASFDRTPCASGGKRIVRKMARCFIPLSDGRIFLKPRFSLWQFRCGLKEKISKRT